MVDVNVNFVLGQEEPIEANFGLEPDVTYTADIVTTRTSNEHSELDGRDSSNQHPISAITGLTEGLSNLSTAIENETSRAILAEGNLSDRITSEVNRATEKENQLADDILAENNRALSAEETLQDNIDNEENRAKGVEQSLADDISEEVNNRISEITRVEGLISDEETRAKGIEQGLRDDLTAETNRATNAEGVLQSNITAEENRAKGVEEQLASSIDSNHQEINNHISDKNNPHEVTKAQVGLGNVENLAPADMPMSTATKTYVDNADNGLQGQITAINTTIGGYGNIVTHNVSEFATASQGTLADTSLQPNDNISELTNNLNYQTATQVANSIAVETNNRESADNNLQRQIDAIVSASDVFDIVGTYAELQAYDISTVPVNDIIKVLEDSTHGGAATYYRCVENNNVKSWSYIGSEGASYTKAEADNKFVPQTRTVNNKALSSDITLTASDVGALPSSTVIPTVNNGKLDVKVNGSSIATFTANQSGNSTADISVPTKTSELTNDSNFATVSQIPTDYVDLTTNQNIGGDKNFIDTVTAGKYRGNFEPGYGGFEYASAYSAGTIKYGRLASILINGTYQTNEVQFMVQQTNKLPSLTFGEIKTRVHDTAGTVNLNDTALTYTFMPKEMIDTGILNGLRLYYWNNFDTNQAKVEIWIENPTWTTTTFSIIDTISTGNGRSRAWTFYQNDMYDDFPSDATGYKQARLNVLSIGKPTEDTNSSIQADTVGARNTKLQNYALSSNVENTYLEKAQQGVILPNFDAMPVIATYEYDVATTTYQQLFTRTNTETEAIDLQDIVYCRIYVTGTDINAKYDCAFLWKGRENTPVQILAFSHPGTLNNNLTGIRYFRSVYPKALNNGYQYIVDFQTYNTTARHIKVEVFKTSSKITWMTTATNTTYNSSGHNTNQCTLGTNYGICANDTFYYGNVSNATWAGSINSSLNKYTPDNAMPYSGEALLINQFVFMNGNKVYPATNKTLAIEPSFGIVFNNLAYNNNVAVGWDRFKEKVRITSLTNIPHATLARGENCYFRCTTDANGNIYSDNYVTNEMTPGYTWYYVGLAESNTVICLCTTNSHFLTLDTDGKLTAVDGKVIAVPTVNNATLTIQKNGTTINTFTANASSNVTANITVPTKTSDLTNDRGYITGTTAKTEIIQDDTTPQIRIACDDSGVRTTVGCDTNGAFLTYLGNTQSSAILSGTGLNLSIGANSVDLAASGSNLTVNGEVVATNTDVVHKTGKEKITGLKNISNDGQDSDNSQLEVTATNIDLDNLPSETKYAGILIKDINGNRIGKLESVQYTNGSIRTVLDATNLNGNHAQIGAEISTTGTQKSFAPASAETNSIVTTTGISKSGNGYVKFGNGLIIQWGQYDSISGNTHTFTLPTAFSNDNYKISLTRSTAANTTNDSGAFYVRGRTTTSFDFYTTSTNTKSIIWIAVGY